MKTIIAGGRDFDDYNGLSKICLTLGITEVVCGEAKGADLLGKRFALENNIPIKSFPANWDKYGKSAGHRRNKQMADYCEQAVVFWDGSSKGSLNMIDTMKRIKKPVRVVIYHQIGSLKRGS